MSVRILFRRGTASQWTNANPVLASGEMGFETDTRKFKVGDGITNWVSLTYINGGAEVPSPGVAGNLIISNGSTWSSVAMSGDASISATGILSLKNTGSAGTRGSASAVPVFTTDAQGRVTSVTNTSIAISATAITSGTLSVSRGGTGVSNPAAGSLYLGSGSSAMTALAGTTANDLVQWNGSTWARAAGQALGTTASPTFYGLTLAPGVYPTAVLTVADTGTTTQTHLSIRGAQTFTASAVGGELRLQGGLANNGTGGNVTIDGGTGANLNSSGYVLLGGTNTPTTYIGGKTVHVGNAYYDTGTTSIQIGKSGCTTQVIGSILFNGLSGYVKANLSSPLTASATIPVADVAGAAPLASPTFTGTVAIPTLTLTNALPAIYGGTGQSTYATGDLLYASATNTLSKRAAGANGFVLTMSGGVPVWAAAGSVTGVTSITGTAGQVIASAPTGAVTLSLPQAISTGSSPTFSTLTATTSVVSDILKGRTSSTVYIGDGLSDDPVTIQAGYKNSYGRSLMIQGGDPAGTAQVGGDVTLRGGSAFLAGSGNGGNAYVYGGTNNGGSGQFGRVYIGTLNTDRVFLGATGVSTVVNGPLALLVTLNPIYGGTGASSYAKGDILYASATDTLSKLPAGTDGQVLTMASGVPTWQPASGGGGTVTNVSGSTVLSGLTLSVASQTTTPVISLTGTLGASSGGTGAAGTLTGYVKAAGAGAMTAASTIPVGDIVGAAPLASPVFTGNPTAPTPTITDNDTSIATTAFVKVAGTQIYGAYNGSASDTTSNTEYSVIPGCTVTLTNTSGVQRPYFIQVSNGGVLGSGSSATFGLIRLYIDGTAVSPTIDATTTGALFSPGLLSAAGTDVITLRWAAFPDCTLTSGSASAIGFTVLMPAA